MRMRKLANLRSTLAVATALSVSLAPPSVLAQQQQSTYTYDERGRLTSETDSDGTYIGYAYDAAGNRTQLSTTAGTNHNPVAVNDSAGTVAVTAVTFDPRVNDSDVDGDTLTISSVGTPSHGSATFTGASVTYTPVYSWIGTDSFPYAISDGRGGTATATITVTVNASTAPPVAVNDSASTNANTAVTFDPRTNDSDPNGFGLTVSGVTQGGHGSVSYTGTSVTYTPASGWYGQDTFSYTVSDGHGGSSTAQVTVTVAMPYTPPTANPDQITYSKTTSKCTTPVTPTGGVNALANDTSPMGYTLTITSITQPANGTATLSGGTVSYTYNSGVVPDFNASDSFTYTISDGHGGTSTATISVHMIITCTN